MLGEEGTLEDIEWVEPTFNFNNIGQAILSIFIISTMDEWTHVMYNGIDSVGEGQSMIENNSFGILNPL